VVCGSTDMSAKRPKCPDNLHMDGAGGLVVYALPGTMFMLRFIRYLIGFGEGLCQGATAFVLAQCLTEAIAPSNGVGVI
jgi:hypothetical protein